MDDWFPNVRQELESFVPHWQELRPPEYVEIPENCNWKVSVENYSECYHCSLNRSDLFNRGGEARLMIFSRKVIVCAIQLNVKILMI